jgi:transporter family protein
MSMNYLFWTVFAMVSYSFVFLFARLAMQRLPSFTVMTVSMVFVMVVSVAATAVTGEWSLGSYTSRSALYAYAAGLTLAGAVVGYFRALATGPVSVIIPSMECSLSAERSWASSSSTNR